MQRTGLKKFMGGLALAGAVALTGVVGFAQQGGRQQAQDGQTQGEGVGRHDKHEGGRGRRGGFGGGFAGRFASRLNLTDAQREQMRQITARFEESTRALREQAHAAGRGVRGGEFNGTFDEAAVRAAAQARASAQVELEVAHARLMSELYNVLTAEQKAQLAAERQQREQRRQEWRTRRQANPNQNQ